MRIAGKSCPFCHATLSQDDSVFVCTSCGSPHHAECWNENGGCTTYACQGTPVDSRFAPEPDDRILDDFDILCPHCGARTTSSGLFCHACGASTRPITDAASVSASSSISTASNTASIYTPSFQGTAAASSSSPGAPQYETAMPSSADSESNRVIDPCFDHIKNNRDHYLAGFMKIRGGSNSWNTAAFFFGYAWLFYRKMIWQGALFLGALILGDFLFGPSGRVIPSIGLSIIAGIFGDKMYLHSLENRIQKLREQGNTPAAIIQILQKKSDVSVGQLIGFCFLFYFAFYFLFALIFGIPTA
jgi:hypothetical protein